MDGKRGNPLLIPALIDAALEVRGRRPAQPEHAEAVDGLQTGRESPSAGFGTRLMAMLRRLARTSAG